MASQLTRKALKQDKFAVEVEHTVDYFAAHRQQTIRYGAIALAVILVAAAVYYFRSSRHSVREQVLGDAVTLINAPVGSAAPAGGPSFPTEAAKSDAMAKAFGKLAADYPGSEEAYIAEYFLAGKSADDGKLDDARKKYQDVADHANANYSSLARFALAQLDAGGNQNAEAEKLLKDLMDHPTDLVSKTQATLAYAKVIGATRPQEARKLINGMLNEKDSSGVNQVVLSALGDIPQK